MLLFVAEKDIRHTWLEHEDEAIESFFHSEINEFSNKGNKGSLEGGNLYFSLL
jgi:hypothetical protein